MINEKAFTRAKAKMALRRTVYDYLRIFFNFQKFIIWLYWIGLIFVPVIFKSIVVATNIKLFYFSEIIAVLLTLLVTIPIVYRYRKEKIEEKDW